MMFWKMSCYALAMMLLGALMTIVAATNSLKEERERVAIYVSLMDMQCTSYVIGQVAAIMVVGDKLVCVRGVYTPSKETLIRYMHAQRVDKP